MSLMPNDSRHKPFKVGPMGRVLIVVIMILVLAGLAIHHNSGRRGAPRVEVDHERARELCLAHLPRGAEGLNHDYREFLPTSKDVVQKGGLAKGSPSPEEEAHAVTVPKSTHPWFAVVTNGVTACDREQLRVRAHGTGQADGRAERVLKPGRTAGFLLNQDLSSQRVSALEFSAASELDVPWEVYIYPASEIPVVEKTSVVEGHDHAVLRVPAGVTVTPTLEVTFSEEGSNETRLMVYDGKDLTQIRGSYQFFGEGSVTTGQLSGDVILVVEAQGTWRLSLQPPG